MKPEFPTIFLIIAIVIWILTRFGPSRSSDEKTPPVVVEPLITAIESSDPVLADTMLANYASEDTSGKEDLNLLVAFLDSVFLLVKQRDTADYSTNEDLVLFLQGSNSHKSPFLHKESLALNDKGQLIDRWGTPIIVHPVSQKLLEIRMAGPDQKPYSEDDLHWPSPK